MGRVSEKNVRKKAREEKSRKKKTNAEKVRENQKKMQAREKIGKPRIIVFCQWFAAQGSTSRLSKAAGAEPCGQFRDEELHVVAAQSTCASEKSQKAPQFRGTC